MTTLQRLFGQVERCRGQVVSTLQILESFGWDKYDRYSLQDPMEFLEIYLRAIEKCLKRRNCINIVEALFHGARKLGNMLEVFDSECCDRLIQYYILIGSLDQTFPSL